MTRVYMFYGQGGVVTSAGLYHLSNRIHNPPGIVVTMHNWDDYIDVVKDAKSLPEGAKIAIVGYSLGANAATWAAKELSKVDLLILLDPSLGLPGIGLPAKPVDPIKDNVKKTIHWTAWSFIGWGRAKVKGHNVEVIDTWCPHEVLDWHEPAHRRTIEAIAEL